MATQVKRLWGRRSADTFSIHLRTGWPSDERTLADELREHPRSVDTTPHEHFHSHGGMRHAHTHVHPEGHAHSSLTHLPTHEGNDDA